ncbi:tricarboxylate carrier [Tilletiaria anomala UBC 951]|uniref:Sidoreflexin n=1 Tax=Tilletiaria anomala (strain ATCC 24038 / CBS 436.72 / UBC 951) TaxID=1037660 RepID=A0A066VWA5_TILAU|nr:tricarboxylate carrier [Tilletiaria anomala UBC 951]KDN44573.1 tricarboxylate carrier [Tilletiaria anomala UBC 951]
MTETGENDVDISIPRHDLSTYLGRLRHFITVTSPLTLLATNKQLEDAKRTVDKYDDAIRQRRVPYLVPRTEAEQYWRAKQIVQSSVHPDTGETIPLPFRMSAFVPTNLIIVGGMLMPSTSLKTIIFWQWANQSLNSCVNAANANKSGPQMTTGEIAGAYAAATSAAVGISVGLTQAIPRMRNVAPGTRAILGRLVPFVAVGSASVVNVGAMRWREMLHGTKVYSKTDSGERKEVGNSVVAGQRAVGMTAASRIFINMPTLVLPPLLLSWAQRRRIVPTVGIAPRIAEVTLIGISLLAFLPPAIAVFPQDASIDVSKLEPRFHSLKDGDGKPVHQLEYNKGL